MGLKASEKRRCSVLPNSGFAHLEAEAPASKVTRSATATLGRRAIMIRYGLIGKCCDLSHLRGRPSCQTYKVFVGNAQTVEV